MEKKKIAVIGVKYFPSKGGTSRVAENIVQELKDHFEFTIYCYKDPAAKNHIPGVNVVEYKEMPFGSLGVFIFFMRCTFHALLWGKYDLVHVHKTDAAIVLPLLSKKFKCIATSHEAPYLRDKWTRFEKKYFKIMEKMFMRANATLTAIAAPLSAYYEREYGRKVLFIPNGVELTEQLDYSQADEMLKGYGVDDDYLFFAARRIMSTKGCHTLVEALNLIEYKGPLMIAGDMSQVPGYTKKLTHSAENLNANFMGYVNGKETLLALVKKSGLFIFPSEIEGMSIMLLEVASVGRPIICSDIPENTAVFSEEEVLYFRNKDATDLAEKILWALDHPEEMLDKAHKAKQKVYNQYSGSRIAQRYGSLYDSSLSLDSEVAVSPMA